MIEDKRSRKPTDEDEAVGFCLQVAATNSALLRQHAAGKSALHADLNPLAHGVRMTVVDALKGAARHVVTFADITAWDFDERATAEQEAARAEAVRAIGLEIAALADRAAGQTVDFSKFEGIRARLTDLGFALKPHHALDVASAVAHRQS